MLGKYVLKAPNVKEKSYHRDWHPSVSAVMTTMMIFHSSEYRCLKNLYENKVFVNLIQQFFKGGLIQPFY